ncbi:hypothetical protein ACFL5U_01470 [Candidatus Margulisiibacteriota bacterium]
MSLSDLKSFIRRLLDWATIDRVVVFGMITKGWEILAGPLTLILIALHFSPEIQGYYYTFGSILTLQVFTELGLGFVIIQFASHEWAKLSLDKSGRVAGDGQALSRLASLLKSSLYWYVAAGCLLTVGLGLGGFMFFTRSPDIGINWMSPWFALCLLAGINLWFTPIWSILEGCNQLREVYFFRLMRGISYSISIWLAMILGAGLWTIAIAFAVRIILGLIFLWHKYWRFLRQLFSLTINSFINWQKEIWPMQWRIALSWISGGFFANSLFVPVLFYYYGPVLAGKMGMTWSIVNMISALAMVLVIPKAPRFGVLIAQKKYNILDRLFYRILIVSFGLTSMGALGIMALIFLLQALNHPFSLRMLDPLPTGLFLLGIVLFELVRPQAMYLHAHKQEPFLGLTIGKGVLVASVVLILGSRYGVTAMALGYLAVAAFFVLPVATIIWYRCRKKWHFDAS